MNSLTDQHQPDSSSPKRMEQLQHINLQLAALGQPTCEVENDPQYLKIAGGLLKTILSNAACWRWPSTAVRPINVFRISLTAT